MKPFPKLILSLILVAFALSGFAMAETLHEAAKKGNLDEVKRLIEKGANVNVRDENSDTPLYVAVGQNRKDIAELLISKGANVNAVCT